MSFSGKHLFDYLIVISAFLLLMVGQVTPDPRVVVFGVPLNWILLFVVVWGGKVFSNNIRLNTIDLSLLFIPFLFASPMLFMSSDIDYGVYKFLNLMVVSILCFLVFYGFTVRHSAKVLLSILFWILLSLLAAALLYKSIYGFFDRQVNFLMNGPIVFARLMGIGCICALYGSKKYVAKILTFAFFLAVVWTQSKGPLLAVCVALWFYYYQNSVKDAVKYGGFILAIFLLVFFNADYIFSFDALSRFKTTYEVLVIGVDSDELYGSVGSRGEAYTSTLKVIMEHPLGVGIGGWQHATNNIELMYPHNLFLEVFSEIGILVGWIFLLPFIVFSLRRGGGPYKTIAVFLLINQMYSGDILDARYLFIFSMLSYKYNKGKKIR